MRRSGGEVPEFTDDAARVTVPDLILHDLTKRYGDSAAVRDVNLEIRHGEFFSILGPSGCGKTTLLRMIAGFEKPSSGRIMLRGREITGFAPAKRNVAMVFQNYALFPHMSVWDNVAFGLKAKGKKAAEIRQRVDNALASVHLLEKSRAQVPHLSGGEQQRVAVARAVVMEPDMLLFDEPLSNLDVALRTTTREEIRQLQRRIGITTLYVTHDQGEALGVSDRIAVMKNGRVEQVGTPREVYENPSSRFVASFLGSANLVRGVVHAGSITIEGTALSVPAGTPAGQVIMAIKPEHVGISVTPTVNSIKAIVESVEFQGFTTGLSARLPGGSLLRSSVVTSGLGSLPAPGNTVFLMLDMTRCSAFEEE
jgi:ABC-type Fe3+/spermidine/putrescine transport system ATPase subunit